LLLLLLVLSSLLLSPLRLWSLLLLVLSPWCPVLWGPAALCWLQKWYQL
jgi:hypothetical protein